MRKATKTATVERAYIAQELTDTGQRFVRRHAPRRKSCGGDVVADIVVDLKGTGNEVLRCSKCGAAPSVWWIVDSENGRRVGFGTAKHGGRLVLDRSEAQAAADEATSEAAAIPNIIADLQRQLAKKIEGLRQEEADLHYVIGVLRKGWA